MQGAPSETATEAFGARLVRHVSDLLRLAWPVMLSRAGMLVMAFVDIIMLGRYSAEAIGAFNLGVSIFVPLMVFTIGLTSGAVPVISRAFGAGDWAECGRAWRRAVSWALMGSGLAALVCYQGETWLGLFGQTLGQRAVLDCHALGRRTHRREIACLEIGRQRPAIARRIGPRQRLPGEIVL